LHLLWCIFFVKAFFEETLLLTHIPGTNAISRNNIACFCSQVTGHPSTSGCPSRSGRPVSLAALRLDIAILVPVVQELSAVGIAPFTKKVYGTGERRFTQLCDQAGLLTHPVLEQVLMPFAVHLFT